MQLSLICVIISIAIFRDDPDIYTCIWKKKKMNDIHVSHDYLKFIDLLEN